MNRSRIETMTVLAVVLAAALAVPWPAVAQSGKGYPYSIMTEEGGAPPKATRHKRRTEPPSVEAPRKPSVAAKRRRGSSSPSPVPPYESVVKPPNAAPKVIEQPRYARPDSPSQIVPGVYGNTGPAVTPPRPAGQSFGDRAVTCVHSGGAQGVGAGQIGAFTGACVNQ